MRTLIARLSILAIVAALTACGGGGDDGHEQVGPPDCRANPSACI